MDIDFSKLKRNYKENPLKAKEQMLKEDLEYLYIELNWCMTKIASFLGNKTNSAIRRMCIKYGLNKTKEQKVKSIEDYNIERYGVKNLAQLSTSQEKKKQTMLERYGVENPAFSTSIKEKKKQTCLKKYGVDNPAKFNEFKTKAKNTCKEKYGTEYAQQSIVVKEKQQKTMMEKYGCKVPLQNKEIKAKQEQTCLEKYGTKNPFQNKGIQQKQNTTVKERYGVFNVSQVKDIVERGILTKKKRGNLNTSSAEKEIELLLHKIFTNVYVQYDKDSRYPYLCDFYIPSLDLFIEYQGFVSHGKKPYGIDEKYDEKLLTKWNNKLVEYINKNKNKPLYDCAYYNYIQTWAVSDPLKRKTAKENKLNWLEFFNMNEFMEWYNNICETLE